MCLKKLPENHFKGRKQHALKALEVTGISTSGPQVLVLPCHDGSGSGRAGRRPAHGPVPSPPLAPTQEIGPVCSAAGGCSVAHGRGGELTHAGPLLSPPRSGTTTS